MDNVERYIKDVSDNIAERRRDEVEKEIRNLISDKIKKYEGKLNEEEKEKLILAELGDPKILADKYLDNRRYLIGPKYFDKYIEFLKLILTLVFIGVTIGSVIEIISMDYINIGKGISRYINTVISAFIQAAGWVTLTFVIMEYNKVDIGTEKMQFLNKDSVSKFVNKNRIIKTSDFIFGMAFTIIFFSFIYLKPQYFGVYFKQDGHKQIIPMLNLELFSQVKFLIIVVCIISISKGIVKFLAGRWSIKLSLICSILSVISAGLIIALLAKPGMFNPDFMEHVLKNLKINGVTTAQDIIKILVGTTIVITLIDIISTMFNGMKAERK